jgi:DNA-binding transcriptional MerR regulator
LEKNLFTIGDVSRIKGITKKALRFYDRIGLLKPAFVNQINGYRFYSPEQFIQIDIIRALREIDVSPNDIKTVLCKKNTEDLMVFLDGQKRRAEEKIEEIKRMTQTIEGVQCVINDSVDSIKRKGVYKKHVKSRSILTLPYGDIKTEDEAIVEFSKFDRLIERYRLINAYQTGILFEQRENGSVPHKIFNTVDASSMSDTSMIQVLPEDEYICVCYSNDTALPQMRKINTYCRKNGITPLLIIQIELLHDVFAASPAIVELQLLVNH